jgi:hypothetical protein
MYPIDASVRTVDISLVYKIFARSLSEFLALGSLWTNKYIPINSYLFALKPVKFTNEETAFLHRKNKKIPDMLFTSQNTPHITLGNDWAMPKTLNGSLQPLR